MRNNEEKFMNINVLRYYIVTKILYLKKKYLAINIESNLLAEILEYNYNPTSHISYTFATLYNTHFFFL